MLEADAYSEIFHLLSPGGVFLNLEHVASVSPSGEALFDDFFVYHLYRFHQQVNPSSNRADIAQSYYSRFDKKENILVSAERQCEWLRNLGFEDVDCFFKVFELALIGGRKPAHDAVQTFKSAEH